MTAMDGDFRAGLAALLPQLRAYARFLARAPAQADDLVQEALLRALGAEHQWQPGTNLRAWTFRILHNLFLEQLRRGGTERRALDTIAAHGTGPASQEAAAELADLARDLEALPLAQREALILVGAHGLSADEAGLVCGVPPGTIKARVSRARAALARLRSGQS